jgi:hypothetical protein
MGNMRNGRGILFDNLKGRDHSEDLGVDGKVILQCILGEYGMKLLTGCIWLRIWTSDKLL